MYCVAAFLAPAKVWDRLNQRWGELLSETGLTEFHTKDCIQGTGEFAKYKGRRRDERDVIYGRFLKIIIKAGVRGFVSIIDNDAHKQLSDRLGAIRSTGYDPYYLAFQHECEMIALRLYADGIPESQSAHFWFDQRGEKQNARVRELYDSTKASQTLADFTRRLGMLNIANSQEIRPLQAADVLAWEARRHFVDHAFVKDGFPREAVRHQWNQLRSATNVETRYFDQDALLELLAIEEARRAR